MGIAALLLWIITAGGGSFLLIKWMAGGGHRQPSSTKFPPAVIFGHFLLAATGLVLWIILLATKSAVAGWLALIALVAVALLGFRMVVLWLPSYRSSRESAAASDPHAGAAATDAPPERTFPVGVVVLHGVLAVATVLLVLITLAGIGTS